MNEIELKPCPFCGGYAVMLNTLDWSKAPNIPQAVNYFVTCEDCGIETKRTFKTPFEVVEVWNRRANNE